MSLFKDFLDGKIVVDCHTQNEIKSLINMLDSTEVRWANGNRPSDYIPYGEHYWFVIPPRDIGMAKQGRLYKTNSSWAVDNDFVIINFSDIDEEQSLRVIPSPLSLLYPKEAPNEPV